MAVIKPDYELLEEPPGLVFLQMDSSILHSMCLV